jgi:UDP-glucuronate decarboxylase
VLVTGGAGFIGSHLCRRLVSEGSEVITFVNLGNPKEIWLQSMAERIVELTGSKSRIVNRPLPPDDPKVRRPDISLAGEVLDGWEPRIPVEEGLERTRDCFAEIFTGRRSTGA